MKKCAMPILCIMIMMAFVMNGSTLAFGEGQEDVKASSDYGSREAIPDKYKWNLEDLYANKKEWKKDLEKAEMLAGEFSKMSGRLGESAVSLKKALDLYVQLSRTFEKAYTYAKLSFHTNKSDTEFQELTSSVDDLSIRISEKMSFFIPELLAIPEKKLKTFMEEPELKEYRRWIAVQLRGKDHTLPKEMEQLLARSGVLAEVPESIFSMLSKDLTFPAIKDESGKEVALTPANYGTYITSQNREVRKRAYDAYYKTINQFKDTFAQILQAEVKKNVFYSDVRKYPSSREASLEANNIPISVYDNLISTVEKYLPDLHRYIDLKKQAAGHDKMFLYDMYQELGKERSENEYIPIEKAREVVKEGLSVLGEDYGKLFDQAFEERWIDVYYTPGKRTGAYQWGAYDSHPFILLNYQGRMDDVYTLAHEFGHAAHSYFSKNNQSYLNASYPIFSAEVASTTNEALLFHEMYKRADTKEKKISILNQRLEDFVGTLFLQTMFAEFEQKIHERAEKGEALTAEALKDIYGSLLKKYFGKSLEVDDGASLGWARIPHFYRNYYVYQYATGFAAANAFAQQIKEEGQPAVERYIQKFLSAGDSKDAIDVLKDAGVDMASPQVVHTALKGFKETLVELERLIKEG